MKKGARGRESDVICIKSCQQALRKEPDPDYSGTELFCPEVKSFDCSSVGNLGPSVAGGGSIHILP